MTGSAEHVALLGLGANVGDPHAQLREAVAQLGLLVEVVDVSSLYLTAPVGGPEQPSFLNLVCRIRTGLTPSALLALGHAIEQRMGRVRGRPNEPRTIDIDLLAYDDLTMNSGDVKLPHPRMHLRGFVLLPLLEVAPEWRHPELGMTAAELIAAAGSLEKVERWGRLTE